MRISDWSSDVCSSDLMPSPTRSTASPGSPSGRGSSRSWVSAGLADHWVFPRPSKGEVSSPCKSMWTTERASSCARAAFSALSALPIFPPQHRSEEHTSELQSLMRISYAVFCLKNKKHTALYVRNHQHKQIQ